MNTENAASPNLPGKFLVGLLVVALLLLGLVGLVLPFIPGLLFLVVAAVLVSRNFPSIDAWLRRNRAFGRHMEWADTFYALPLTEKVQLGFWVCVKIAVDGLTIVGSAVMKALGVLTDAVRRDR